MFRNADCEKTQAPPTDRDYRLDQGFDNCNQASPARPMRTEEIVAEMFRYHPPTDQTIPKYAAINQAAKNFAEVVVTNCSGSDRTDAIRKIREARMIANAAVALDGLSL